MEEILSLVVPVRMEICETRAATFSLIDDAGALGDVVMILVPFLYNVIWRRRVVCFLQFTRYWVRSEYRRGRHVVRFSEVI